MFIVYVIKNKNGKMYTGHTAVLAERMKRHNGLLKNKSKSFTSRNKGTWVMVHEEKFLTRREAIRREKELKSGKGREFIKKILNNQ